MRTRHVQAANDSINSDMVFCKIVFNQRTGKLRWIFRPDNEYIPIYSDDDFEDLIGAHFVKGVIFEREDGEEIPAIQKQSFTLDEDRKSTRLNSSHVAISYAVFCLKKKK